MSTRPAPTAIFTLRPTIAAALAPHGLEFLSLIDVSGLQSRAEAEQPTVPAAAYLKDDLAQVDDWLASGAQAGMAFMRLNAHVRADPRLVLPSVRSVLIVAVPYATGRRVRGPRQRGAEDPPQGELLTRNLIARYARGKDYHKVIRRKLQLGAEALARELGSSFESRAVVDSVPFLERAHGRLAGLGFIGKNTMLIRPGLGSYFFIASLLVSLDAHDLGEPVHKQLAVTQLDCGDCRLCLDACPTNALPRPYFLDANRCLSYLSIEHRSTVPDAAIGAFEHSIFGCDICQSVCPYNLTTLDRRAVSELSTPIAAWAKLAPLDVARMTQLDYERWFGGTAITRARYGGLVRNALYHLHATGSAELTTVLTERQYDADKLIRATVAQLLRLQRPF